MNKDTGEIDWVERATAPVEDLKERVNAFLWWCLPGGITLDEAEKVACQVHDMIMREWELHKP